jgi:hypothetical protein
MTKMLYMVVERFKNKDAVAVYRRFRDRGRMAPDLVDFEVHPVVTSKEAAEKIAPWL